MNPDRKLAWDKEREKIQSELGYYVYLDEAASMMQTAQKIVALIVNRSYAVTYKEARLILRLADNALREIAGETEKGV